MLLHPGRAHTGDLPSRSRHKYMHSHRVTAVHLQRAGCKPEPRVPRFWLLAAPLTMQALRTQYASVLQSTGVPDLRPCPRLRCHRNKNADCRMPTQVTCPAATRHDDKASRGFWAGPRPAKLLCPVRMNPISYRHNAVQEITWEGTRPEDARC